MAWLDNIMAVLDKVCKAFIVVALIVMTVVLFSQVTARRAFNSGIAWSDELARYLMIWMVYIGAAVVFREGTQISVTAMEEMIKNPRVIKALKFFQHLVCAVFIVIIGYCAMKMMPFAAKQTSANMIIPMNWIYMIFPISSVLIAVNLILKMVGMLIRPAGGKR